MELKAEMDYNKERMIALDNENKCLESELLYLRNYKDETKNLFDKIIELEGKNLELHTDL